MKKLLLYSLLIFLVFSPICTLSQEIISGPAQYVNPFIGTSGYGHTFPGAALPFGMVQLSPSTGAIRDKGYSYSSVPHGRDSETIIGFTHTNQSGTGIAAKSRYSNILLMPTVGELQIEPGSQDDPESGYRSRYSHDQEKASAGYYMVLLKDYGIKAELTVSERAGMHRYTFPETDKAHIIIDITRERQRPELHKDAFIEIVDNNIVQGYTTVYDPTPLIKEPMTWYFFAKFSKPFDSFGTFVNCEISENNRIARGGFGTGGYLKYSTEKHEEIIVKVGISFTGIEGAKKNLEYEMNGWDFDLVKRNAENAWNEKLNKIDIIGGTENKRTQFYTAFYHSLLFPRVFSDVDGAYYSHFQDRIIYEEDFRYHVDFSLWDTYRTQKPLLTIIEPCRKTELIKTLLATYDQGGRLPAQYFKNSYHRGMIGDHGATMICDAYNKGLRDFDTMKAYEAMMKNAQIPGAYESSRPGLETYLQLGYIAAETVRETVSKTLEYSHTDWALAQVARDLGKNEDYKFLMKQAGNYKNFYDDETGFYRPRFSDGTWLPLCDRRQQPQIARVGDNSYYDCWDPYWIGVAPNRHYTESNAWQYLFYPQHDVHGLINLMGGKEIFIERLDGLFYTSSSNEGPFYGGVTGAIGQYIHGNQPSFHKSFLYNYAGSPWKTQERVRGILETLYRTDEWGLPGNEDMGSMSAWYIFAALGFYPVTPGLPVYTITSPLFERAVINLDDYYDNRQFTIIAHNASGDNKYIQSAKLNGQTLDRTWITHEEIIYGGVLEFILGPCPNIEWGSSPESAPPSMSNPY